MTTTITALDGTGDATFPFDISGWAPDRESANVIHRLIAPGEIAVTLVGDLPRSGVLSLLYTSDADAASALELLGRATSFALTDSDRPIVDMTFVREGRLTPAIHDQDESLWKFSVGFQEITP